ncbi:MAG TPA: hypothetical protein VFA35_08655, partial [Burkholderiaceae bacterium]|nr:hypothetical protein [Burkholderiaceae bacterium]
MTDSATTEASAQHELLRLALHNSARSVLLLVVAVAVIVAMGVHANRPVAAGVVSAVGLAVAVWRVLITRRHVRSPSGDEADLLRLQWEL